MEGLKRFYDQNRKGIWIAVIVIALFIILLQLINSFVAKDNENNPNSINLNTSKVNTESKNVTVTSGNTSALGESVSTTKVEKDSKIISTFFDNLNNGKFEDAFNMLTDECKEEMFSTVDELKEDYYNNIFNGERKSFEIENWANNTYKVDIVPDMLATGKSNNGEVMQDHITVDDDKLNINNYIGRTNIEKSKENDGVTITINYKDAYMDYEKYNITVKNEGDRQITLDSLENPDTMYIEDRNGVKYSSYNHELTKEQMQIGVGETNTLEIKYYSTYISTKDIRRLVFSNFDSGKYNNEKEEFNINI